MYKRYIRNTFLSLPYDDEDDQKKKIFFSSFIFQKFSEKKNFWASLDKEKKRKKFPE